jgi:iron-sulfur cluster repair protein YtfE (RIC family)
MNMRVPAPISAEHHELNVELERATKAGGMTGAAAKEVARLLHDHMIKEEEIALPPLTLLKSLTKGDVDADAAGMRELTARFEAELPGMLAEHFAIVQALNRLADAADSEGLPEHMRFAEKLISHVKMEEDVLYPAALLVGRHLKTLAA